MSAPALDQIVSTTEIQGGGEVEQERSITQNAATLMERASLEQIKATMPAYAPVVEDMIVRMDYKDPSTISDVGLWAMEGLVETSLKILSVSQQAPSYETIKEVQEFKTMLREHIAPLEARLKAGAAAGSLKTRARGFALRALARVAPAKTREKIETNLFQEQMGEFQANDALLGELIVKTIKGAGKVKEALAGNRDKPAQIAEQLKDAMKAQSEAAEKLYLTIAAVNDYQKSLTGEIVPALIEKASSENAVPDDLENLTKAKAAILLVESNKTNLMTSFVESCLQHLRGSELAKINAGSAMEMDRLEKIAVTYLLAEVGGMVNSYNVAQISFCEVRVNDILADTKKHSAQSFVSTLEARKQVELSKQKITEAVISSCNTTVDAIERYREFEAQNVKRQREAQAKLGVAFSGLRTAAARLAKEEKARLFENPAAEATTQQLIRQATGVEPSSLVSGDQAEQTVSAPAPVKEQPKRPASSRTQDLYATACKK